MLKKANFTVKFCVDNTNMQEDYWLSYRTEEWDYLSDEQRLKSSLTHIQQAKQCIAKDLGCHRHNVEIKEIYKIHNHLIIK